MIELNQLRIGNLVKEYDEVKKVNAIKPHGVDFEEGNFGVCPPQDMNPIPLTEAVLMAAGFYYITPGIQGCDMWQGFGYWKINRLAESSFNRDIILRGERGKSAAIHLKLQGYFESNIDSLHQLQNLYYALTGKELEINMEELKRAVG